MVLCKLVSNVIIRWDKDLKQARHILMGDKANTIVNEERENKQIISQVLIKISNTEIITFDIPLLYLEKELDELRKTFK